MNDAEANPPPLQPLSQAILSSAALTELEADLGSQAQVLQVQEKGLPTEYSPGVGVGLAAAFARLRSGQLRALQVRYVHGGKEFSDSLFRHEEGFRLVRFEHQLIDAQPAETLSRTLPEDSRHEP